MLSLARFIPATGSKYTNLIISPLLHLTYNRQKTNKKIVKIFLKFIPINRSVGGRRIDTLL